MNKAPRIYLSIQRLHQAHIARLRIHVEIVRAEQTEGHIAALRIVALQSIDNAADAFVFRQHYIIHVLLKDRRQICDTYENQTPDTVSTNETTLNYNSVSIYGNIPIIPNIQTDYSTILQLCSHAQSTLAGAYR